MNLNLKKTRSMMLGLYLLAAFAGVSGAQSLAATQQVPGKVDKTPAEVRLTAAGGRDAVIVSSLTVDGRWALGVVNNGGTIKYRASERVALEGKALYSSGVYIVAARFYYYLNDSSRLSLFCGAEADYIGFKGKLSKGAGIAGGGFVGGDVYLTRHISLALDFGPMYIGLRDGSSGMSVGGIDYVLNLGVYWHF